MLAFLIQTLRAEHWGKKPPRLAIGALALVLLGIGAAMATFSAWVPLLSSADLLLH